MIGENGGIGGNVAAAARIPNASQGNAIDLTTLYLEDYASSGVIGSGNDSAALQAAFDDIVARDIRKAKIRLPPVVNLGGNPRTDRNGNALVALPHSTANPERLIVLEGVDGDSNLNVVPTVPPTYDPLKGPPSGIGGPTTEQLGVNTQFSSTSLVLNKIKVFLPSNPTIAGIDLSRMRNVEIGRLLFVGNGGNAVQPTNPWAFGIWLPEGTNSARIRVGLIDAAYVYAAVIANSAHLEAQEIIANYCALGLGLTGNGQYNANDGHSSHIGTLLTQECNFHIASYDPDPTGGNGAMSLPVGNPGQIVVDLWDIEDWAGTYPGPWSATSQHILDANNQLFADITYARVVAQTGKVSGALTRNGGRNARLRDLTLPAHNGAPALAVGTGQGTGAPTPTVPAGFGTNTDKQGAIQFGTGTTPAAGRVTTVTYADAFTVVPKVTINPLNALTQALGLFAVPAVGGFNVFAANAPAASQAGTTYQYTYTLEEGLTT